MKDYNKNTFWQKRDNEGNVTYFIKINGIMVEVNKDVYNTMASAYRQSLRESKKQAMLSFDAKQSCLLNMIGEENQPMDAIYQDYLKKIIHTAIEQLGDDDYKIIIGLFFDDLSEAEIGRKLNMSRQLVNYKKVRILKELRKMIDVFLKE